MAAHLIGCDHDTDRHPQSKVRARECRVLRTGAVQRRRRQTPPRIINEHHRGCGICWQAAVLTHPPLLGVGKSTPMDHPPVRPQPAIRVDSYRCDPRNGPLLADWPDLAGRVVIDSRLIEPLPQRNAHPTPMTSRRRARHHSSVQTQHLAATAIIAPHVRQHDSLPRLTRKGEYMRHCGLLTETHTTLVRVSAERRLPSTTPPPSGATPFDG